MSTLADRRCGVCGRWYGSFAARVLHALRAHPEYPRPQPSGRTPKED